jgi:hypothetical protein
MKRSFVVVLCLLLFTSTWRVHAETEWRIDWYTVDSGGVIAAAAGDWQLSGTIGQHDATRANAISGGGWMLTGGFWSWLSVYLDSLFSDRFEHE